MYFFGAPNTNNCCMLAVFFSFSSCPSPSPPKRDSSGVTRHTHTHTQLGGRLFLFTSTQAMFSCFLSSFVHTPLTLPWLVLSRFLVAIWSLTSKFASGSSDSLVLLVSGFLVRLRLGFSSFVFLVRVPLFLFFFFFFLLALHHTLEAGACSQESPARVFSPSPSLIVSQGMSRRARQVGPCLCSIAVRL